MEPYLSDDERQELLRVARDGLESAVEGRPADVTVAEQAGLLAQPGACFVTLYDRGELRGCIGGLEAKMPLAQCVRTMAEAAALRDPRFHPVAPAELSQIDLSLSVLTPLRRIDDPAELEPGVHGLVVSRGHARGVLLPQVAAEPDWDRETFLAQTCRKAGLPENAWRDPATTLEVFTAEVFAE